MVNNFTLLRDLYAEHPAAKDPDGFLYGQIMARKKDGGCHVKSNNKVIKDIILRTPEDFDTKQDEIIELCRMFGARAYLNVNPRSYKTVVVEMAGLCLDHIRKGSEAACRTAFSTACGRLKPKGGHWVIDVDDLTTQDQVRRLLPPAAIKVPTVNGVHFLTKGFDLRELRSAFPEVDVHKNNPTILYFKEP